MTDIYFGYELIRSHVLTNILGEDTEKILYWAGKELAREFEQTSFEDITAFFAKAGWGELSLERNTSKKMTLTLKGEAVDARIHYGKKINYALESGFLAKQLEFVQNRIVEAHAEINHKKGFVLFTIMWEDFEV